ncbi:HAMP domain-containing sensor histidine kinase [Klenkia sp. PcliD-1-E]|uniref:sensor histidine kinase n=1 Tax=Klenkia sp. PcliD-1-E TaxID=2954492 RepID=UPI0020971625|nr:HAMP domain-containing sensor histidine kinase [Klenkia sp. PcliD-1-E]MCO7218657.1 HAMP domain-containing histidine kinase [Klenkia sp. PcliD-1-E]
MRRRITLLVAATTSVVLLAFLLPAAALVSRVAEARALDAARQQVQTLLPVVALAPGLDGVTAAVDTGLAAGRQVAVVWPDGTLVGDPAAVLPAAVPSTATTVDVDGGTVVVQPVARGGGTAVVTVRVPDDVLRAGVLRTWLVLGGLGVVLFTLALLVADRLAHSLTRPVSELAATADRLGRGELDARVEPAGPADIRAVGTAVNRLAGRIGELLVAERENAADLAHRLRTPLTALRLDVDALPAGAGRDRLVEDVDELSRTVDAVISEARRPVRAGLQAQCDAVAVVADRVAFWAVLAEDEDRVVDVDVAPGPLPVRLPAADLAAAVDALLGNVFAHTPAGTPFAVTVAPRAGGGARLVVADRGPGVHATGAVQRGVSGRGSTGLGLDIARRTAEASGGAATVAGADGTQVVLELGPPA